MTQQTNPQSTANQPGQSPADQHQKDKQAQQQTPNQQQPGQKPAQEQKNPAQQG